MEKGLILSVTTLLVFMVIGVQGTSHLSFASNTTQVNITRTGCGTSKLCVETPSSCDPAGNSSCLFTSVIASTAMAPNGVNLSMQLSGNSSGYIGVGLQGAEGTTLLFICAQNSSDNGTFFFRTMSLSSGSNGTNMTLTGVEQRVTEIRSMVNGDKIQCEFNAININASQTRSKDTTFSILLGAGKLVAGVIQAFDTVLNSGPLNIADPAANVANTTQAPNTTVAATTTSGASDAFRFNVVLLPLSVLALSFLKSA